MPVRVFLSIQLSNSRITIRKFYRYKGYTSVIIPSLTVQKIKKRYSPQFVRAPAIGALVLLYSNVQLAKMQALK